LSHLIELSLYTNIHLQPLNFGVCTETPKFSGLFPVEVHGVWESQAEQISLCRGQIQRSWMNNTINSEYNRKSMSDCEGTCEYVLDPDDPETWGGENGDDCHVNEELFNENGVWTCPHEAGEGEELCIFHKPVGRKDSEKIVDAFLNVLDDATEVNTPGIQARKLQFYGAQFEDFNLSDNLSEIRIEGNGIDISHAEIHGRIDWSDVTLDMEYIRLRAIRCTENADFGRVDFEGTSDFQDAKFKKDVNFKRSTFNGSAIFKNAEFTGEADFETSVFEFYSDFRNAVFCGKSSFLSSKFNSIIYFSDSEFNKSVGFNYTEFKNEANFTNIQFSEDAIFSAAEFGGKTKFEGAEFAGDAQFEDILEDVTRFSAETFFHNVDFVGDANFQGVKFEGHAGFVMSDFNGEINFDRAEFKNSVDFRFLDLKGAKFTKSDLTAANFNKAVLHHANLESAILNRAILFKTDLRGAQLSGALLGDIRIDEETQFLGHPDGDKNTSPHTFSAICSKSCCVYDPYFEGNNKEADVDKAKSVYRALEELASKAARPRLQSQSFVRRQDLQKDSYNRAAKEADSWEERLIASARYSRAKVARETLLYGESPWRIVGGSFSFIVLVGLIYPLGEWLQPTGENPITYSQILDGEWGLLLESFYFSTLTFTTLGMGDYQPLGFGQVLATINTAFGAILIALLVFVLGRRAAR